MIQSHCNIIITAPTFEEGPFKPHQACHLSIQTLLKIEAWTTHQQLSHQYSHIGYLYLPSVPYPICKNTIFLCALICHGTLGSLLYLYNSSYHKESCGVQIHVK